MHTLLSRGYGARTFADLQGCLYAHARAFRLHKIGYYDAGFSKRAHAAIDQPAGFGSSGVRANLLIMMAGMPGAAIRINTPLYVPHSLLLGDVHADTIDMRHMERYPHCSLRIMTLQDGAFIQSAELTGQRHRVVGSTVHLWQGDSGAVMVTKATWTSDRMVKARRGRPFLVAHVRSPFDDRIRFGDDSSYCDGRQLCVPAF